MIDILIPVLGRPQNAAPLVHNIRDTTTVPFTITFLCSTEDTAQREACLQTGAIVGSVDWKPGPGDYAKKINHGFRFVKHEWIFQGADDLIFHPGWDINAIDAAEASRADVVATNDMSNGSVRRGQFGTHNLIRRRHVTDGHVLYEGYDHNFVDRELCGRAQQAGVYAFARNSRVKHNHPLWRTAKSDPTYVKSLARFREDQALFLSRAHLWGYHGLSAHERKMAA